MTKKNTAYVTDPGLVYVLMKSREEFNLLGLDETDHGVTKNGGHVLTKYIEARGMRVVFQYWVKDPAILVLKSEASQ